MRVTKEIIKAIDDELLEKNKHYLLLGQANKLLSDLNFLTVKEKSNQELKKLLENNEIPHAYLTNTTPKQWRIPLSSDGKKRLNRNKSTNKKTKPTIQQDKIEYNIPINLKSTYCPRCRQVVFIPKELINELFLDCPHCGKIFMNHQQENNNSNYRYNNKIAWVVIGIIIIIFLTIIGELSNTPESAKEDMKVLYRKEKEKKANQVAKELMESQAKYEVDNEKNK